LVDSVDNLNAFRLAKDLHSIASQVGYANPFQHYYQACLEFEEQRAEKLGDAPKKPRKVLSQKARKGTGQLLRFERRS
jgi:hypothetical protein